MVMLVAQQGQRYNIETPTQGKYSILSSGIDLSKQLSLYNLHVQNPIPINKVIPIESIGFN